MNKKILAIALLVIVIVVGIVIWQNSPKEIPVLSDAPTQTVMVMGTNFIFSPLEIRAKKGELIKIILTNTGTYPHDLVINELNVRTLQINPGETTEVSFTPDQIGEFEYYCSVGTHREKGMIGKFIVE